MGNNAIRRRLPFKVNIMESVGVIDEKMSGGGGGGKKGSGLPSHIILTVIRETHLNHIF